MKKNVLLVLVVCSSGVLGADCPKVDLGEFHENPQAFLDAPLKKYDKNCDPVKLTKFDADSIADRSFIEKKDQARKSFCHTDSGGTKKICLGDIAPGDDVLAGRAPIESLDRAENLVPERAMVRSLERMEETGLTSGEVETQPWSDWYWPIAVGQLSYRYNDSTMMNAMNTTGLDEKNMWTWVNNWHRQQGSMPADINALSPSEKYDLLMGDTNYTLTKKMLEAGTYYQQNFGKVEAWMGLCHGWSPASYMLPRPSRSLTLKTPNGEDVTFLPTDLKALGTLLWSNGRQQNKFVGGRCNQKNPAKDPVSGKVLDSNCFDTNPGSWHMTVVSHVGAMKRPFVMDATFDYEVWNHPVTGYKYSYFNPQTMEYTDSLEAAKVALSEFGEDKFAGFRGPEATTIVGVTMEVDYLVETRPSSSEINLPEEDAFHSVSYTYDLELNEAGEVVGGEWYTNSHPDFLWTPYEGSRADSVVDDYISMDELPLDMIGHPRLLEMAPYASENAQPIGRVVEAMLRAASH